MLIPLLALAALAPQPVTTGTLLSEMHDLARLAHHPGPGVRVVQFSSYDRRSSVPGGPDWFGNSDGFGNEPIPGFEAVAAAPDPAGVGEYTICDVRQPGAIVRTWTAAIAGRIRVFLDGSDKPWYDGPADRFLMHRASWCMEQAGVETKGLLFSEQRYADYFPIPFAKGCRIVWVGKLSEVHFYHVQLKLYPEGTPVVTFNSSDLETFRAALAPPPREAAALEPGAGVSLEPGERKQVAAFDGPGEITEFTVNAPAGISAGALRGTLLRIAFDGHQSPQVLCPVGDFFGAAPGIVPYESAPMSVSPAGVMTARWVMPYKSKALVSLENRTGARVNLSVRIKNRQAQWTDDAMHFRCNWRAQHDLTAKGGADAVDLPFLNAHGAGQYVGTAVSILNPCPVPTAGGNWWGEGDEKVFVDGEARPSIFGTGSEDYFNYAWSESDLFEYPYFAQPLCTGPETRGLIVNSRWHILDAIPFEKSLEFAIELFSHTGTPHLSYARTCYWYGKPGARDDTPPIQDADLIVPALPSWTVRAAGGASGATIFEAETAAVAGPATTIVESAEYSAGKLARLSARGDLKLNAAAAGKARITLTCTSGPEKAAFTVLLDGKPLQVRGGPRVELQTPHRERLVNIHFEPIDLPAGDHTLTLDKVEGAPGIDFIWLKPVK